MTAQQTERPTTRPVDTEVRPSKPPARSAAERLRIVEQYDSYPAGSPERGALLRREGVYSSAISKGRTLRRQGALSALATQQPGPKSAPRDPREDELAQLRAENARLTARLAQVELLLDMQQKGAALLGASSPVTLLDARA